MKKITSPLIIAPLVLLMVLIYSCQKTSLSTPKSTVSYRPAGDFLKNNYEFSLFYAAIEKAGLVDSLNGPGPFTIFAPDDNAFNLIGIHAPSDFDKMNTDSLRFILKYHILNRKLFVSDVPKTIDNIYTNADGLPLYLSKQFANDGTDLWVNGVQKTRSDVIIANGVIQVIQQVLKYTPTNMQDFLSANPDLSYFVTGLKKFNLWDSLKTAGPYTVMAPTNEAFIKNGITLDSLNKITPADYDPYLFKVYVLYPHHIFFSDFNNVGTNGGFVTDGNYQLVMGNNGIGYFHLNLTLYNSYSANFSDASRSHDNVTTNGIVDLLDNLLYLPADAHKQ